MHFGTPKEAHMFSQGSGPGLYESKTYHFKSEKNILLRFLPIIYDLAIVIWLI